MAHAQELDIVVEDCLPRSSEEMESNDGRSAAFRFGAMLFLWCMELQARFCRQNTNYEFHDCESFVWPVIWLRIRG